MVFFAGIAFLTVKSYLLYSDLLIVAAGSLQSHKLRNLKMLDKQMQIGRTSRNVMTHHDAVDIGF